MNRLTPTQRKILRRLPATPDQLAQALYGRATASEHRPELVEGGNLVYVHVALLRRRLNGTARITSRPLSAGRQAAPSVHDRQSGDDGYAGRIIYELKY